MIRQSYDKLTTKLVTQGDASISNLHVRKSVKTDLQFERGLMKICKIEL